MDVERVRTVAAGKKSQVVVALDSDSHPTSDDLEQVSKELGEFFDAREEAGELNFGAGYTLEVTTPGVDLPLTEPRHWRRNHGRRVALPGGEGEGGVYRIGALNDAEDTVVLVDAGARQPGVHLRAVSGLQGAVVEIEFNTPPAAEMELVNLTFDKACERAAD